MKVDGDTENQVLISNEVKGSTLFLTRYMVQVMARTDYQLNRL